MFTVYVLYSKGFDKIYIGYTSNLELRLMAHNMPNNKGWTKNLQPWEVIYTEEFSDKASAMKRELQLKSQKGREFIRGIITLR